MLHPGVTHVHPGVALAPTSHGGEPGPPARAHEGEHEDVARVLGQVDAMLGMIRGINVYDGDGREIRRIRYRIRMDG